MNPIIEVIEYSLITAHSELEFRDLSFKIMPNEITCFWGPNGCGKTTLLKIILRLLEENNSAIIMNGELRFAYVPQNPLNILLPWKTVRNNIEYLSQKDVDIEKICELVSFPKDALSKRPLQLSGGNLQKVAIAIALSQKSDCICMDEPFANLDRKTTLKIVEALKEISKGKPILIITHDPDIALQVSDKIIILDKNETLTNVCKITDTFYVEKAKEGTTIFHDEKYNTMRERLLSRSDYEK